MQAGSETLRHNRAPLLRRSESALHSKAYHVQDTFLRYWQILPLAWLSTSHSYRTLPHAGRGSVPPTATKGV